MISISKRDKTSIISFSVSKINALISDEIREEIIKEFDNSISKIIIDLKGVEYIDSSGFGCFLSIMRAAKSKYCIVKFASPEPKVMDLFKILNLNTIFQIYDDIDVCIRSFK